MMEIDIIVIVVAWTLIGAWIMYKTIDYMKHGSCTQIGKVIFFIVGLPAFLIVIAISLFLCIFDYDIRDGVLEELREIISKNE